MGDAKAGPVRLSFNPQLRTDPPTGRNFQFALPDLFRQSIYSRLAGYEDTNDAERWHVA